jgi:O-antigen ligase
MHRFEPNEYGFQTFAPRIEETDLVSQDLQQRTNRVLLALLSGLGLGVCILLFAGSKALLWLGFGIAALVGVGLLTRFYEAGIVLFLLLAWLNLGSPEVTQGGSGGGSQRLMLSHLGLVALLFVFVLKRTAARNWRLYKTPINAPMLLYFLVCVWSAVNSILFPNQAVLLHSPKQYTEVNVIEVMTRALCFGGVLVLANMLEGKWLRRAAFALVVPGILITLGLGRILPAANYLAFPQIVMAGILGAVALDNNGHFSRRIRIVSGLLAAAVFGILFLGGLDWVSGWIGAGVTLAIVTFRTNRRLFMVGVVAVLLVVIVKFPTVYQKVYVSNFYGSGPTHDRTRKGQMGTFENDRTRMLRAAVRYADNFPLGIGPGNYRSYNDYFGRVDVWNTTTFTSAHGTYAQTLSETGWPGLVFLLLLLYTIGRTLKRYHTAVIKSHAEPWKGTFLLGAHAALIGVFVASFNGDYLFPTYHNGGMAAFGSCIYMWLLLAIVIAIARDEGLQWETLK